MDIEEIIELLNKRISNKLIFNLLTYKLNLN